MGKVAADAIVITGRAHGRRATLEVSGDRLTWRANRGGVADNVATTLHDAPELAVVTGRWSLGGAALATLGAIWQLSEGGISGFAAIAVGVALLVQRLARPVYTLAVGLGSRTLVMLVDRASIDDARVLGTHHARAHAELRLTDGISQRIPPTLP